MKYTYLPLNFEFIYDIIKQVIGVGDSFLMQKQEFLVIQTMKQNLHLTILMLTHQDI